jgi:hypothetical protein
MPLRCKTPRSACLMLPSMINEFRSKLCLICRRLHKISLGSNRILTLDFLRLIKEVLLFPDKMSDYNVF